MPPAKLDAQAMARRAAGLISPGDVVAVDAGLPSLAPDLTPPELGAWFLRNNGMLNDLPLSLADAAAVTRGGYVNLAIVNAAQVDAAGSFAGLISAAHPGLNPPGNAVDLAANAGRVIAMLPHTDDDDAPRTSSPSLAAPPDGAGCVNTIITDAAVIAVGSDGLILTELAPGWTADDARAITGANLSISPALRAAGQSLPRRAVGIVRPAGWRNRIHRRFRRPWRDGSLPADFPARPGQPQPYHRQQHRRHRPRGQFRNSSGAHRH